MSNSKLITFINRWTVGQMDTEDLEKALGFTRQEAKRSLIVAELATRQALSLDRPLSLEDFLG